VPRIAKRRIGAGIAEENMGMTFSKLTKRSSLALALSGSLVALSPIAQACTRALYAGTDDMVVTGRSMDWMETFRPISGPLRAA